MADHESTLDPQTRSSYAGTSAAPAVPVLRLLYHGDLSRIGAETLEGALLGGRPVVIGRRSPSFAGVDGSLAPLDDPCVSRAQFTVAWREEEGLLAVTPAPGARRAVFVGAERQPVGEHLLPPGSLIEIDDRVLLWFDRAPIGQRARDPMGMIGESAAMYALRRRIGALAPAGLTALVRGETGVGKELVVRALHAHGTRARGPLVAQNCGAMPEQLMESEFFGHVRGAFTGADRARVGLFEQAVGGTLFLDEIGELPTAMQAGLLRVLQERRVRPVGGTTERAVDVCIIAATHRDLAADVAQGRFREDLYARIERPAIDVPPLRDRREDVPLLFTAFLAAQRHPTRARLGQLWQPVGIERSLLPCSYMRALMDHRWPRNVRELHKLAEDIALRLAANAPLGDPPGAAVRVYAVAPMTLPSITPGPVEAPNERIDPNDPTTAPMRIVTETRPSCAVIADVLRDAGFSPSLAARRLGVVRNTVYAWMADCGLPRASDYSDADLADAVAAAGSSLPRAADALRISLRALKLRLAAREAVDD